MSVLPWQRGGLLHCLAPVPAPLVRTLCPGHALPWVPFRCASGSYARNEEPSLDEILAEPIVRLLMLRDRVDESALRRLAAHIAKGIARRMEA